MFYFKLLVWASNVNWTWVGFININMYSQNKLIWTTIICKSLFQIILPKKYKCFIKLNNFFVYGFHKIRESLHGLLWNRYLVWNNFV